MSRKKQADAPEDPVLTTRATARLLGVAVSTAQLWIESGAVASWKTPGGHRRVRLSSVSKLLEERASKCGASAAPRHTTPASGEFLPEGQPTYPVPPDEAGRLQAVNALNLVDTPAEPVFDRLTWLASLVTESPITLLTLLTARLRWFKSRDHATSRILVSQD